MELEGQLGGGVGFWKLWGDQSVGFASGGSACGGCHLMEVFLRQPFLHRFISFSSSFSVVSFRRSILVSQALRCRLTARERRRRLEQRDERARLQVLLHHQEG